MRKIEQTLRQYIENRINKIASGCWIWTKATNERGYGVFKVFGTRRQIKAHRATYQEFVGAIPEGMDVLHRCDNPPCCNPEHLFLGTHADNMRDCARKGRVRNQKKKYCINGHPFDKKNTYVHGHGLRRCRTCRKKRDAERYQRRKAREALCEKLNAL